MFDFVARWLGLRSDVPPARLREAEAIVIARAAVSEDERNTMSMATLKERDGKMVWVVSSATIGAALQVTIDDATGDVRDISRLGGR